MDRDDDVLKRFVPSNEQPLTLEDFWGYLPAHKYIHSATRQLWPPAAVNGRLKWPIVHGKAIRPSAYLDRDRSVEQMTWHPDYPEIISDKLPFEGGWIKRPGARRIEIVLYQST